VSISSAPAPQPVATTTPPEFLKRIKVEPNAQPVVDEPIKEIAQEATKNPESTGNLTSTGAPANKPESTQATQVAQQSNTQKVNEAAGEKMDVELKDADQNKNCLWITNLANTTKAAELKVCFFFSIN
jgi:hypothetical protein